MNQRTLSIIKPDGVRRNIIGNVCALIEQSGLKIVAAKMKLLSYQEASEFYVMHIDQPFYNELVQFMTSGKVMIQVLEGDNAIECYRSIMGHTDPALAAPGTIRAEFATSIGNNVVHGSDSIASAEREIAFFFAQCDLWY